MAFNNYTVAAKDRVLFQTYDSIPDIQTVALTYAGPPGDDLPANNGIVGYVGGIKYIYMYRVGVGEYAFALRNIFGNAYTGVAVNSGVFDFNFLNGMLQNMQVAVTYPTADIKTPIKGGAIFSIAIVDSEPTLQVNYFQNNALIDLGPGYLLHLSVSFLRNLRKSALVQEQL